MGKDQSNHTPQARAAAEWRAASLKRSLEEYWKWLTGMAQSQGSMLASVAAGRDCFSGGFRIDDDTRTRIDGLLAEIAAAIDAGHVLADTDAAHRARSALVAQIAPSDAAFQRSLATITAGAHDAK
jgi:hypothetical protein